MKLKSSQNNIPRNTIAFAIIITAILGLFRLLLIVVLVWVITLVVILIYQYRTNRSNAGNFVCLDCATVHQDMTCPKCGSKFKKIYSRDNRYGI